jgi:HlyD family secretion protein
VERIRRRLSDTVITAPRSGTVTTRAREAGEYVAPGTAIFTIADLSTVFLTIYIPEPMLGNIAVGLDAEVTVDGMEERTFRGRVSRIAEEAEFTPKNVQTAEARAQLVYAVGITIDNSEEVFKIGMPADARILSEAD